MSKHKQTTDFRNTKAAEMLLGDWNDGEKGLIYIQAV